MANSLLYRANFHWYRWPNIEPTIYPSGHTYSKLLSFLSFFLSFSLSLSHPFSRPPFSLSQTGPTVGLVNKNQKRIKIFFAAEIKMEKVEMQQKIKCKARNEAGTHTHNGRRKGWTITVKDLCLANEIAAVKRMREFFKNR